MEPGNELAALLESLRLEELAPLRFRAAHAPGSAGVVFGGQIMAQAIAAAVGVQPGKPVKTLHTVFARGATVDEDMDVEVEEILAGRAFGSLTVTFRQHGKTCARSQVLLSALEPDLVRHAVASDPVAGPDAAVVVGPYGHAGPWENRVVGGIDVALPEQEHPARLSVWSRWPGAPRNDVVSQQLLAWASDPWFIGISLLPHRGFGQSQAHHDFSTGVITHTLTFHEPFHAGDWLLLAQEVPHAGGGRAYGRAQVFTEDGRLVASYVQDAMARHFPADLSRGAGAT